MQSAENPMVSIAQYKHGKQAAFSFTFDDGWRGEVEDALSVLDSLDLKGTFFFMPLAMEKNPKSHATWETSRAMQSNGHEIGTHAKVKPRLHECDPATLGNIVNGGYDLIKEKTGVAPVSFAMPGGSHMTDPVKAVVYQHHAFVRKPNTFKIAQIKGYGEAGRQKWNETRERDKIEETIAAGGWRIATIHGIKSGYSKFPGGIKDFRSICTWVKEQQDRLWVAPMGTVGRYLAAREACSLTVQESNAPGTLTFTLTCPDGKQDLFTEALTVVIKQDAEQATAVDAQGHKLPLMRKDKALLIDVVPGGPAVTVTY